MDLREYQERAAKTDRNPTADEKGMMIPLLGLAGEAGELLTEYKKRLRDGESHTHFRTDSPRNSATCSGISRTWRPSSTSASMRWRSRT